MADKVKQTKKSQLIGLMKSKSGVTVDQISAKLGWQSHTTRAALTRLRQAGCDIALKKSDKGGGGRYSIASIANVSK